MPQEKLLERIGKHNMDDNYQNQISGQPGEHVLDLLSSYIDNALEPGEQQVVRAHLNSCLTCRSEHDELLSTQMLLRNLPVVSPPRAFTLTPEMVAPVQRGSFWQRLLAPRLAPRYATGSIVALALMVLLVLGNYALIDRSPTSASTAMMAESAPSSDQAGVQSKRVPQPNLEGETPSASDATGNTAPNPPVEQSTPAIATQPNTGGGAQPTEGHVFISGGNGEGATASGTQGPVMKSMDPSTPSAPIAADQYAYSASERAVAVLPGIEIALALVGVLLAAVALLAWKRGA